MVLQRSYLDFNDMITKTISLFKNHKEIAEKFRGKYQYIPADIINCIKHNRIILFQ